MFLYLCGSALEYIYSYIIINQMLNNLYSRKEQQINKLAFSQYFDS